MNGAGSSCFPPSTGPQTLRRRLFAGIMSTMNKGARGVKSPLDRLEGPSRA